MSNMNRIRKYYSTMDKGEKAYMANKLFKEDSVVAAKVKVYIPDEILYPKVAVTYAKGEQFTCAGDEYILAQVGSGMACLIGMEDGNYWSTAVEVGHMNAITEGEFALITDNTSFTKVGA